MLSTVEQSNSTYELGQAVNLEQFARLGADRRRNLDVHSVMVYASADGQVCMVQDFCGETFLRFAGKREVGYAYDCGDLFRAGGAAAGPFAELRVRVLREASRAEVAGAFAKSHPGLRLGPAGRWYAVMSD